MMVQTNATNSVSKSQDVKTEYLAVFSRLVDIVEHDGKLKYLVYWRGRLKLVTEWRVGEKIYRPPPRKALPYLIPRAQEVFRNLKMQDEKLFKDLIDYHGHISELPSVDHYVLLAAYDALTYLYDRQDYCPVINFAGLQQRGKTRTGKGMVYVCYRGIETTSVNEAHILRWSEDHGATILFDVRDFSRKVQQSNSEDVFLKRFERGSTVPRVLNYERSAFQDTRNFRVYGPTIIASNEPLSDLMESRSITIVMGDSRTAFPSNVRPESGLPYREALVAFRARHMLDAQLPVVPKPSSHRLGDVLQPLASIIALMAPRYLGNLRRLAHQLEQERLADRSLALEARIVLAVEKAALANSTGKVSVREVHSELGGAWMPLQMSHESLGRKLTALGFARSRMTGGPAAIIYDQWKVDRLKRELGVD